MSHRQTKKTRNNANQELKKQSSFTNEKPCLAEQEEEKNRDQECRDELSDKPAERKHLLFHIVKKICDSPFLFIQLIRVTFVLGIVLHLLFWALPHNAFFFTDIEMETINEIEGIINSVDIDTEGFEFCYTGTIHFETDSMIINGKEYKPKAGKELTIGINSNSNEDAVNVKIHTTQNGEVINFFSSLGRQDLVEETSELNSRSLVLNTKEETLESTKRQLHIKTDATVTVSQTPDCYIRIIDSFVRIQGIINGDQKWWDEKPIDIYFPNGVKYLAWASTESIDYKFEETHVNSIDISQIDSLKNLKGNGIVSVSYNPTPEEYPIKKQELDILSNNKTIVATISSLENDQYLISAAGYADNIELSKNNLMPTMKNWFKGNAYMLPTTVVTIIGGAITLTKKNIEDDKKKKGNSPSEKVLGMECEKSPKSNG